MIIYHLDHQILTRDQITWMHMLISTRTLPSSILTHDMNDVVALLCPDCLIDLVPLLSRGSSRISHHSKIVRADCSIFTDALADASVRGEY